MSVLCDVCAGAIISNFQHVSDRNCALVLGLRFNMLMKQSQEVYKKKKKERKKKAWVTSEASVCAVHTAAVMVLLLCPVSQL